MQIDLTTFLQVLLALLGTMITSILIPYIKAKTSLHQQNNSNDWVTVAVQAAEMIYAGSKTGEEKKTYVREFLKTQGVDLNEVAVDSVIEATTLRLKQGTL